MSSHLGLYLQNSWSQFTERSASFCIATLEIILLWNKSIYIKLYYEFTEEMF